MMSKRQWIIIFSVLVIYVLLGTTIFYEVENTAEQERLDEEIRERKEIEALMHRHYVGNDAENDIYEKLTVYCGKPVYANMTEHEERPLRWDFYHSLFFVITVVTTIGYGNLAPTAPITRIFLIFYALVGVPLNGIVIVTLGEYFAKSFKRLYKRWKTASMSDDLAKVGLIGQIGLYLLPGLTFFMVIPSIVIKYYEDWPWSLSISYCFVTISTIGFGDFVAGTNDNDWGKPYFGWYKAFLLIWIIFGLGYGVMVIGFITRGMRHKKIRELEHKLATNIKKTPIKVREELRSLLNEFLFLRVKPVYRENFIRAPAFHEKKSSSCPDLTIFQNLHSPTTLRKRAFSVCDQGSDEDLPRVKSDSDLSRIDRERTFNPSAAVVEPSELLIRVVNALGNYDTLQSSGTDTMGVDGFTDSQILSSENYGSEWTLGSRKLSAIPSRIARGRASSETRFPIYDSVDKTPDLTWYGQESTIKLQELRERAKYGRNRSRTLPVQQAFIQPSNLLTRIKNTFKSTKDGEKPKQVDVERQDYIERTPQGSIFTDDLFRSNRPRNERSSVFSSLSGHVLEETTIADFIRALAAVSVPETVEEVPSTPRRKLGTAGLTPPKPQSPLRLRRFAIRPVPNSRRSSLMPAPSSNDNSRRRLSLRPEVSIIGGRDFFAPPPPYTPLLQNLNEPPPATKVKHRRFSLRPVPNSAVPGPLQRQVMRLRRDSNKSVKDSIEENPY